MYRLEHGDGFVRLEEVAKEAQLSISQAKDALEDLSELKVIEFVAGKGIKLAKKGKIWAMSVVRKHRLTKDFLTKLGVDPSEAHPIAHKLEHLITENGERHLEESLERLVPAESNDVPKNGEIRLSSLESRCSVIISRITGDNEKLIKHLVSVGVIPGVTAIVKKRSNPNSPLILRIGGLAGGFEVAVGKEVASSIMVRPTPAWGRHRRFSRRRHRWKRDKT
ncbi:MAG: metal-dependent transcriptional regulator [Promethearchaeota archaeon]